MNRRDLLMGTPATRRAQPSASRGPEFYTNALLRTHDGREVRFYDDLIKDKIVGINFFYTNCDGTCPKSTMNLVALHKALGDRIGKDVFIYSMTLKPHEDDVAALKKYAADHGVGPGWLLLTGDDFDLTTIRFRISDRVNAWDNPGIELNIEQHSGMLTAINDRLDRWTMMPLAAKTRQLVRCIDDVSPTKPWDVRYRENIKGQALLDEEAA